MLGQCPHCGEEIYLSSRRSESICYRCGNLVAHKAVNIPTRSGSLPQAHYQAMMEMRQARNWRREKNRPNEIRSLRRALHYNPRLLQAHLRLGRILPDVRERRKHLLAARRIDPENMEAITLLSRLHAQLTPEQAARFFGDEAPVKAAEQVHTETQEMECPRCRGALRSKPAEGRLECPHCGYQEALPDADARLSDVQARMAENLGKTRWQIGERLMACDHCGAQWAHETRLSTHCPYCQSAHIVLRDSVGSFQQPDGVIPFATDELLAQEAIEKRLERFQSRLRNLFDSQRVKRIVLRPVYLPFWVFDEPIDIRLQTEFDVVGFKHPHVDPRTTTPGRSYDLGICGVKTIPQRYTQQLGRYFRFSMRQYVPGILDHPAEIYEVPLNQAVLRARSLLAMAVGSSVARYTKDIFASDFSGASYQLVLAPVWLGTLYEEDGDVRSALVNGQTRQVVLGRSRKPTENE